VVVTFPAYGILIAGTLVDSEVINECTITYGRQRVEEQFLPATCTLTMLNPATPFKLGDELWITAEGVYDRFFGSITSMTQSIDTTTITATSQGLGYLAQSWCKPVIPGDYTGSDWNYIGSYLARALQIGGRLITFTEVALLIGTGSAPLRPGVMLYFDQIDSGPRMALTAEYGSDNMLATMQTIGSNSSLPLLYEDTSSNVYWSAPVERDVTATSFKILPEYVMRRSNSTQAVTGMVNRATVTYNSGTIVTQNYDSVSTYGRREVGASTQLLHDYDAEVKGARIIGQFSDPYWQSNPVSVLLNSFTYARTISFLAAKAGTLIDTSSIAAYFPGMEDESFIEGWTERFNRTTATVDLYLSPWSMTRYPQAWSDVTASKQWNDASLVGLTWTDLIRTDI
jgi:hypothetical protein